MINIFLFFKNREKVFNRSVLRGQNRKFLKSKVRIRELITNKKPFSIQEKGFLYYKGKILYASNGTIET